MTTCPVCDHDEGVCDEQGTGTCHGQLYRKRIDVLSKQLEAQRGLSTRLRGALEWAFNAADIGPPESDPGHFCGPEAGCDSGCIDRARYLDGKTRRTCVAERDSQGGSVKPLRPRTDETKEG